MSGVWPIAIVIYFAIGIGVVIPILLLMATLKERRVEPTAKDVPELKRKISGLLESENDPIILGDVIWYMQTRKGDRKV